ncbi:MAG: ribonuclease HII [bacterium]
MLKKNKKLKYPKNYFEKKAWQENLYVCGIDEVGRGCFAGPLVVSAAILPINTKHKLLKDSKVLTEQERELAYEWLIKRCFYSTAIISNQQIDKINIYQATKLAMKKTFYQILQTIPFDSKKLKSLLIDAIPVDLEQIYKKENLEVFSMNYGESISTSIAAASIIAKVTRDNLMKKIHKIFPSFKLDQHKGYGTQLHRNLIINNGISIIHRKTFVSSTITQNTAIQACLTQNTSVAQKEKNDKQTSLFR